MMKRVLLLLGLALCSLSAMADEASHRQAAEELLLAGRADKMFDEMMPQMLALSQQMASEMTGNLDVPEEKRPALDRYFQRVSDLMADMWRWERIKPDMIDLYVAVYSEQEMRDITAFYRTPAG